MRGACRGLTLAAAAAALALGGRAAAQDRPAKEAPWQRSSFYPIPSRALSSISMPETEQNDTPARADSMTLGDEATGEVNPAGDVDYFVFAATAGTTVELDVSASDVGSPLDPTLELFDADGVTSLAFNDDDASLDSRIVFTFDEDGDYFVALRGFLGGGGSGYFYSLRIDTLVPPEPGPGDPTTLFVTELDGPSGMAFDDAGRLFVSELYDGVVSRIEPDGSISTFASGIPDPAGLAFDAFGDLLVAAAEAVYKVSADGTASPFIGELVRPWGLAVGPDGDLWVMDTVLERLLRYDPFGALEASFDVGAVVGSIEAHLAFSPAGDLYLCNGVDAIVRFVGGELQPFIRSEPFIESIAFDVDGYLYVANGFLGKVLLYAPDGSLVNDPFANTNLGGPITLAFGRDAGGTTGERLFASNMGFGLQPPFVGSVVEMNPGGIRAPGWPVTVRALAIVPDELPDASVGADYAAQLSLTEQDVTASWSLVSGELPPGVHLDPTTGTLAGVAEEAKVFNFLVKAEAENRVPRTRDYSITVTEPAVSVTDAADGLFGVAGALTADEERFLDLLGNRNGDFDVGDFRALLISRGGLASPDAPSNRVSRKESR